MMNRRCHSFLYYFCWYCLTIPLFLCIACTGHESNSIPNEPTELIIEASSKLLIMDRGEERMISFKVLPSGYKFNYDVESDDCQLHLKHYSQSLPFKLVNVVCADDGSYEAFIEDLSIGQDYEEQIQLVLEYYDSQGMKKEIISKSVKVKYSPKNYSFSLLANDVVYNHENHAAFTSIIAYKGNQYLAFRDGLSHMPSSVDEYAGVKILRCKDGSWEESCLLKDPTKDLRDPFFVEVDGKLRVYLGYNTFEGGKYQHSGTAYSDYIDGKWGEIKNVKHDLPHIAWLWKIRQYTDKYYSVAYLEGEKPVLMISDDGIDWKTLAVFNLEGILTEADLCFVGKTVYVCLRKDSPLTDPSYWGVAQYPFTEFKWKEMETHIESPELLRLPYSSSILLAGREWKDGRVINTSLFSVSLNGKLVLITTLDEGNTGDMGYPSLLYGDGILYCSYYTGVTSQSHVSIASWDVN